MIVHLPGAKSDQGKVDRCMDLMLTLKVTLLSIYETTK